MAEYLTIVHDVADYDAWRPYFDADKPNREAAGLSDLLVVRNADAPNTIGMIFAAEDPEAAMAIAGSPELAETMQKAGVIGQPSIKRREGEFTPQASHPQAWHPWLPRVSLRTRLRRQNGICRSR